MAEGGIRAAPHHTLENHMEVWPGHPYPLGAAFDGTGTNFAISEVADRVELCLLTRTARDPR
ncbi:hypothetical protein QJS66_20650 [Kocuria rhizophila]|nr:hypothetical protein QJS66_20650 [Kocuria rhizophila]